MTSTAGLREALEPCPFCGGTHAFVQNAGWQANTFMRCPDCRITMGLDNGTVRSHEQTVAAWNRRPSPNGSGEQVSPSDPLTILAGIEQFGLAADGSDLRDLRAALSASMAGPVPEGWRCFHCDETFTDEHSARLHFGRDESQTPACQIKGSEGGLVEALRRAENDAAEAWHAVHNETTDAAKAYFAQNARHQEQLRAVEQIGYDRGIADAKAHPETLGLAPAPALPEAKPVAFRWRSKDAEQDQRWSYAEGEIPASIARSDLIESELLYSSPDREAATREAVTDAMVEAACLEAGWLAEPYTAPRESGVPIENDMSEADAAEINQNSRAAMRGILEAALAQQAKPQQEKP